MKVLFAATLLACALAAGATELDLSIPRNPPAPATTCDSTVVQRCSPRAGETLKPDSYRELERRRGSADIQRILEAVVIEGERVRRTPSLKELLESRAPPPSGVSFVTTRRADGSACTCSTPCPGAPIAPCCVCSKGGSNSAINGTVN